MSLPAYGELYYHCKHDPADTFSYLYFCLGVGLDTETDEQKVMYVPLYDTDQQCFIRELTIFQGTKTIDGVEKPRFALITDPKTLKTIYDSGRIATRPSILSR